MTTDALRITLTALLQSGTQANPALNELLSDYARYHLALVIVGGLFTLAFTAMSVFCWIGYKKAPKIRDQKWSFEKKTYFHFGLLATVTAMLMALIVLANVSNAIDYRKGFAGTLSTVSAPVGTPKAELHQSFNTWLQSGDARMPIAVQDKINERLAWQLPKAIISTILLAIFVVVSVYIWGNLIKRSKTRDARRSKKENALLALGTLTVVSCSPLILMVIGNTQAVAAPIVLTMLFG